MEPVTVGLLGFALLIVLILLRVPVAISMIVVSLAGYGYLVGVPQTLARAGSDVFSGASSYSLSVIPLFVFMGVSLSRARIARQLYDVIDGLFGRIRGALSIGTIGTSVIFASVSGSATASASTMSAVAVPEMQRHGYDDGLAAASAAVGGTLGHLLPPSAVLVLYGILTEEPIGQVLLAGVIPGIITAAILMGVAHMIAIARPDLAPQREVREKARSLVATLKALLPVLIIFGVTVGGIYLGVFTPTEAGSIGAFFALVVSIASGRMRWPEFKASLEDTVKLSAMIFFVIIAGRLFGFFLSQTRIPAELSTFVSGLDVPAWMIIAVIFAIYFGLGVFMDEYAILVLMTPIVYPIVIGLGYSGIWFGVVTTLMLLTGLLTPPVGLMAFVASGVSGVDVMRVFKWVTPFWIGLIIAIVIMVAFPDLALFLPETAR